MGSTTCIRDYLLYINYIRGRERVLKEIIETEAKYVDVLRKLLEVRDGVQTAMVVSECDRSASADLLLYSTSSECGH